MVIAWSRGSQRVRHLVQRAVTARVLVLIPTPVIAETTRDDARDAPLNRAITSVGALVPVTEVIAREAVRLLAAVSLTQATVDALIVATAMAREPTIILTGDVEHIGALASGYTHVRVEAV